MNWRTLYERYSVRLHLLAIGVGLVAVAVALLGGDWRWLIITAFATWYTVRG